MSSDGRVCAGGPTTDESTVGRPDLPVLDGEGGELGRLPLGTTVEVLEVVGEAEVDGVVARTVRVRAAGLEGTVHAAGLTDWAGELWWERQERDVPFGVVFAADGPHLHAEGRDLALGLPAGGELSVDVDRWGELEPLVRVRMCEGERCPWQAVSFVDGELRVISAPDAWQHPPELLEEEPDCEAARPLEITPAGGPVVDVPVPGWVDEPPGPAHCRATGDAGTDGILTVCSLGSRRAGFLVLGEVWTYLPCGSDPLLELAEPLQLSGRQVRERGDVSF